MEGLDEMCRRGYMTVKIAFSYLQDGDGDCCNGFMNLWTFHLIGWSVILQLLIY